MDLNRLATLLRCVECGSSEVRCEPEQVSCSNCGRVFSKVNGIYDLRPPQQLPLPHMYNDPHYRSWMSHLASAQDFFYQKSPLIRWVQQAGHRHIHTMNGKSNDALTLDLGCGDGAHRAFTGECKNTVGLDLDQASLEKLRTRFPDYLVVRGDGCRLPFADACFDRVLSIYNLEHLLLLDWTLEEVSRVLKPGGTFFVSVPTEGGLAWGLGRTLTSVRHFSQDGLDYRRSNAIDHCNCIWQIRKALDRHFVVNKTARFPTHLLGYHTNLIYTWRMSKRPSSI